MLEPCRKLILNQCCYAVSKLVEHLKMTLFTPPYWIWYLFFRLCDPCMPFNTLIRNWDSCGLKKPLPVGKDNVLKNKVTVKCFPPSSRHHPWITGSRFGNFHTKPTKADRKNCSTIWREDPTHSSHISLCRSGCRRDSSWSSWGRPRHSYSLEKKEYITDDENE